MRELTQSEREEVAQMLKYLHNKLGARRPLEVDFYLYVLKRFPLPQIKEGFRLGVESWKWMPQPAEIVIAIKGALGDAPAPSLSGCAWCFHGWRYAEDGGPRRVTPCVCDAGHALVAARQRRLSRSG